MSKSSSSKRSPLKKSMYNMSMEEVMEEIEKTEGKFAKPILQQLESFLNSLSTLQKPRELDYLIDLIRDLFNLIYLVAWQNAETMDKSDDDEYPQEANEIANFLSEVLDECRKLNADPHLFPSHSIREAFLTKIASLCSILGGVEEMFEQLNNSRYHPWQELLHRAGLTKNDLFIIHPAEIRSRLLQATWPQFHPYRPGAKNPWNNWLDNSARAAPQWTAVQQKIPRLGNKMNKRKYLEYNTMESAVEEDQLLPRDQENDWPQIPEVGHEFRHMTWSGFATEPTFSVGFCKGTRKSFDSNEIVTLEYLNRSIRVLDVGDKDIFLRRRFHGQPRVYRALAPEVIRVRRALLSNVPYFRFAMAYRP